MTYDIEVIEIGFPQSLIQRPYSPTSELIDTVKLFETILLSSVVYVTNDNGDKRPAGYVRAPKFGVKHKINLI